jgi:hypothetical protein
MCMRGYICVCMLSRPVITVGHNKVWFVPYVNHRKLQLGDYDWRGLPCVKLDA